MRKIITILGISFCVTYLFGQVQEYPLSRQDSALIIKYTEAFKSLDTDATAKEASDYLNQIATIYWEHNIFREAIKHFQESLVRNEKLGNSNAIAMINSNLALIYTDLADYSNALIYFKKTLAVRYANKETIGIISALINMSVVYNSLQQYDNSVESLLQALDYARELNAPAQMRSCYGMLSETYEKMGMVDKSLYYFEYYRTFHEMIQSERISQIGNELENEILKSKLAEEEADKKRLELLLAEKELETKKGELQEAATTTKNLLKDLNRQELEAEYFRQETEIKELQNQQEIAQTRKAITIILIIAVMLTIILLIAIYAYISKRKANILLSYKNDLIREQSDDIVLKNNELNISKARIESINREMTSSITYAKYIQQATLQKPAELNTLVKDSFIYFKPLDLVSGDFYWFNKVDEKIIIASVDCTGHGVPGGFISMLGIELLNKVVLVEKKTNPVEILQYMDKSLLKTIKKNDAGVTAGMEISLCTIDYSEKTILFASAKTPLFIIQNNEMQLIKGTKHTLGEKESKDVVFALHKFDITDDTHIYMFTDGYLDQIGGRNNKRIGTQQFVKYLYSIHKNTFKEQQKSLAVNFEEYATKYKEQQIDDNLIIGIKL